MFGFFKRRLFRTMYDHINGIKVATYSRLVTRNGAGSDDPERNKRLAAAITNRVFGTSSPMHEELSRETVNSCAVEMLTDSDEELFAGIVMALRTMMLLATDRGDTQLMADVSQQLQWIKSIRQLPTETPCPSMLKQLSVTLQGKYCSR